MKYRIYRIARIYNKIRKHEKINIITTDIEIERERLRNWAISVRLQYEEIET